ncbi:peptidase M15 [Silvanigrella paludirubra]|uniref:Peptidase M15 n=1 Tax=Silvanigrella paludirubra TaxID=2499159 RepID=A0A6N6VN86_9BACT|nr:D-Ala-D-Ala carboxypeptidase family metallohydrolase [Silvanigrella paludirubra]KAB8035854.1 peptidase M15 [Silvanigrella paludirubra]
MKLSNNFSLEEFEHSYVAIARGINNKAPEEVINNLKKLCENALEPLRQYLNKPIKILSGYRCEELNNAVNGVKNSQHLLGCAADITVENIPHPELFEIIKNHFEFDQLILEYVKPNNSFSGWVHVSWNENKNRNKYFKLG